MLAGSLRSSIFSPASTWPVPKSISSQDFAPVGTGAGGVGTDAGVTLGMSGVGAVCAIAAEIRKEPSRASRTRLERIAKLRKRPSGKADGLGKGGILRQGQGDGRCRERCLGRGASAPTSLPTPESVGAHAPPTRITG